MEAVTDKFYESFDATVWARAFVEHIKSKPEIATDEATMTGWFANAIMRGYDEKERRDRHYEQELKAAVELDRPTEKEEVPNGRD